MERLVQEIELEFNEVLLEWVEKEDELQLILSVKGVDKIVRYGQMTNFRFVELDNQESIHFALKTDKGVIGISEIPLNQLFGQTQTQQCNTWIPLLPVEEGQYANSYEKGNCRIRIKGKMQEVAHQPRQSRPKPIKLSQEQVSIQTKCPYLKKLALVSRKEQQIELQVSQMQEELIGYLGDIVDQGPRSPTRSPTKSPTRKSTVQQTKTYLDNHLEIEYPSHFNVQLPKLTDIEDKIMRNVVIGVKEKLNVFQNYADECDQIEEMCRDHEQGVENMDDCMKETKEQFNYLFQQIQKLRQSTDFEKQQIQSNITNEGRNHGKQVELKEQLEQQLAQLEEQNKKLKSDPSNQENADKVLRQIQQQYDELNQERKVIQTAHIEAIDVHQNDQSQLQKELYQLLQDKKMIQKSIFHEKHKLQQLQQEQREINNESIVTKSQNWLQNHLEVKLAEEKAFENHELEKHTVIQQKYDGLKNLENDYMNEFNSIDYQLDRDIQVLSSEQSNLQKTIEQKQQEVQQFASKLPSLEQQLVSVEAILQSDKDLQQIFENRKSNYYNALEKRQMLYDELKYVTDFLLLQCKTQLAEDRIHKKLKKIIEEKAHELFGLRKMVGEKRREKSSYVPIPYDTVDLKLSQFVNGQKITVPIVREGSELYLFGTKRVHITLQDDNLFVDYQNRIQPIQEFVDKFAMEEEKKFDHPRSTAKRLTAYSSQPMANSPSKLQRQTSKGNSPSKLQRQNSKGSSPSKLQRQNSKGKTPTSKIISPVKKRSVKK